MLLLNTVVLGGIVISQKKSLFLANLTLIVLSAAAAALFFIPAIPFFSVKVYTMISPETVNISGIDLLSGKPYTDFLSSAYPTRIDGSVFYIFLIVPAVIMLVTRTLKSKIPAILSVEPALPVIAVLGAFLAKIAVNGALSKLPHYLTGDYNHENADKILTANIGPGFVLYIILYSLMFICIAYEQIKKDPDIVGCFKNPRTLVLASLFVSFAVIGDLISIPAGEHLFIRFGFIFISATAFLFGPMVAFAAGMISNTLSFLINSNGYAFDVRYTVIAGFAGILYGIFLYRRDAYSRFFIINIFLAKASVNLIVNIILNFILMRGYFGNAAAMFALIRIFKNVGMLPIEMLIMLFVLKAVSKAAVSFKFIKPYQPIKKLEKE